jgi:beta-glucosidase
VKAPAGTGVVPVTVTDAGGASNATIMYTYTNAPGAITGYAGRCVDDWLSRTVNFNKIDIYGCNGTNAQKWTIAAGVFTHAGGTISLTVLGGCMDVRLSGGANGTLVDRYHCNGTGAQLWSAYAHNQLRNPESGKCLTDVGYAINGRQLVLSTCKGNPNQRWILP